MRLPPQQQNGFRVPISPSRSCSLRGGLFYRLTNAIPSATAPITIPITARRALNNSTFVIAITSASVRCCEGMLTSWPYLTTLYIITRRPAFDKAACYQILFDSEMNEMLTSRWQGAASARQGNTSRRRWPSSCLPSLHSRGEQTRRFIVFSPSPHRRSRRR